MSIGSPSSECESAGFEEFPVALGTLEDVRVMHGQNGADERANQDSGLSFDPNGELELPLASQEPDFERDERLQQVLDAISDPRE